MPVTFVLTRSFLKAPVLAALVAVLPTAALADIRVDFVESAPKDSFQISNDSDCTTGPMTITFDLNASAGKLIFDTTASGAGVEVYQPFQVVRGAEFLADTPNPRDGQHALTLSLKELAPGKNVKFTIDVDDTLEQSELGQIRVSGSEIEGGTVRVNQHKHTPREARFDRKGDARIPLASCPS